MAATAALPIARPATNRKGRAYRVYAPRMTLGVATNFEEKLQAIAQIVYKLALGFILNQVGYYFFVTMYYGLTQNPWVVGEYNDPHWAFLAVAHTSIAHGVVITSWVAKPWYVWFRHAVIRGAGEYLFRIGFAIMALTDPLSPRRQAHEHTAAARFIARWLPFVPVEAQERPTGPIQLVLTPLTSYVAGLPGISAMFGLEGLLWVLHHATADWHTGAAGVIGGLINGTAVWYAGFAPKAAGIVGGLAFAKFIYMKISVDFQDLMVYWFVHHRWEPHWPLPATFRAYYHSGLAGDVRHNGLIARQLGALSSAGSSHRDRAEAPRIWWVTPLLLALPIFVVVADYVGLYIIVHAYTTLQTHYLFGTWGLHALLNPAWMHVLVTRAGMHYLL